MAAHELARDLAGRFEIAVQARNAHHRHHERQAQEHYDKVDAEMAAKQERGTS